MPAPHATELLQKSTKVYQWTVTFCTVYISTQVKNEIYYGIWGFQAGEYLWRLQASGMWQHYSLMDCNLNSCGPTLAMAASVLRLLDHTQRTTVGRTSLDEWPARRRDFYLTTHNTHDRQTSMPPNGIQTLDLSRRTAAGLRLRLRGHWNRQS
jgi:hypothetical protein